MSLKDFIGQEDIVAKLRQSLAKQTVSHSYVFSGAEGIGKKTLARAFVSELVCTFLHADGPCGKCDSCKMIRAGIPVDSLWVQPEGGHIGVDDIRGIQGDVIVRPFYSDRKVYVIPSGETMTVQAQNSLLKILEEPPSYAVFIILAESGEVLLPTVMSRVVHYALERYTKDQLCAILAGMGIRADADYMNAVYGYSGGIPGKAAELVQSEEFAQKREDMIRLILSSVDGTLDILDTTDYFDNNKKGDYATLFNIMQLFYRDALVMKVLNENNKVEPSKGILTNTDKIDIVRQIEKSLSVRKMIRNIQCVGETLSNVKRNANFRLAVENMLCTLAED